MQRGAPVLGGGEWGEKATAGVHPTSRMGPGDARRDARRHGSDGEPTEFSN